MNPVEVVKGGLSVAAVSPVVLHVEAEDVHAVTVVVDAAGHEHTATAVFFEWGDLGKMLVHSTLGNFSVTGQSGVTGLIDWMCNASSTEVGLRLLDLPIIYDGDATLTNIKAAVRRLETQGGIPPEAAAGMLRELDAGWGDAVRSGSFYAREAIGRIAAAYPAFPAHESLTATQFPASIKAFLEFVWPTLLAQIAKNYGVSQVKVAPQ